MVRRCSSVVAHRKSSFLFAAALAVVHLMAVSAAAETTNPASSPATTSDWEDFTALGTEIRPGTKHKLTSMPMNDFVGMRMAVPVWIARGAKPGKSLAVTGGIHGDELNGIEIARRVFVETAPQQLSGTLIVLPLLNRHGFLAGTRYMSDRRDLNRAFPGSPNGSSASIIAHSIFKPVILRSDALIDLHTASDTRINLPQIRTNLKSPEALALAQNFGDGVVLNDDGPEGSLRRSALDAGIPSIIYEAGGVLVLEPIEIERGVKGVRNVMRHLGMLPPSSDAAHQATVYKKTSWLRVPKGAAGMFLTTLKPGDEVKQGDTLGKVVDPLSDKETPILSPWNGVIIGMEKPNVVYSGDALFHIGLEKLVK